MTEELRDNARALGLDRLTEEHLAQFELATTGMERQPEITAAIRPRSCRPGGRWRTQPSTAHASAAG